jgi:hypothetical protein
MDQIQKWNEYCEMLADLEAPLALPEEEEAYDRWLAEQNRYFDEEAAVRDAMAYGLG